MLEFKECQIFYTSAVSNGGMVRKVVLEHTSTEYLLQQYCAAKTSHEALEFSQLIPN